MDLLFHTSTLTTGQQKIIKDKEPDAYKLLAASYEKLKEKQIPEQLIQAFLRDRKALSLEECQNIWKTCGK